MANPEHLAILKQGVEAWNRWRREHLALIPNLELADLSGLDLRTSNFFETNFTRANLRAAKLSAADARRAHFKSACLIRASLNGANLVEANLDGADLSSANLNGANLQSAQLSGTDLRDANLRGVNFTGASLCGANLCGSNLCESNLYGANVSEADFRNARVSLTVFACLDLRAARGLEGIIHSGPSSIAIDTISKSRGAIPEIFLRGAGVPDSIIAYFKALAGKPVIFYSCFISYSTQDQAFADRLYADLQAKGVRCWFAPHRVAGGKKLHEQIDEAIRLHERLLLILSPESMASEWVKTEIAKARKREVREQRRVLFPVRLVDFESLRDWECFDADTGKDSAREIREYFIPDFSQWKDHDSYQQAFDRLLRDLKTDAANAS